jgi:hypothetical protein
MFRSDYRLRLEVLWIFRVKARFYRHTHDDTILMQFQPKSYEVDNIFKGKQYQVHALFSDGTKKSKYIQNDERAVLIGRMLSAGYRNMEVAKKIGVDQETVARLRKAIDNYRGYPMLCRCGDPGGHQNTKKCHPLLKLPDEKNPPNELIKSEDGKQNE